LAHLVHGSQDNQHPMKAHEQDERANFQEKIRFLEHGQLAKAQLHFGLFRKTRKQ
jgi:hypothetical protein